MSRRLLSIVAVLAAAVTACSEPLPFLAPSDSGALRSVTGMVAPSSVGWQQEARALVASANMSPLAAARVYAAVGVAQYRGVVAIDFADTDGQLAESGVGAGGRSLLEAQRGAVAGASANVLSFFFPAAATSLEQRVEVEADAGPGEEHPQFARGLDIGRAAGTAIVDRLKVDGFTTPWTGTVPTGPGMWKAVGPPAGATFGGVTPYFLTSGSQFRPEAPPAFGSLAFFTDFFEIAALAGSRTSAQLASALYWNLPAGQTPPGYWNAVAADYVASNGLNERAATRVFALTNAAMMDALIGCWDAKYYYWTIRPSQVDPQIIPLAFALPNHPSYPSGHSCVSSAAATVLTYFFPGNATELATWVTEAGLSRMYAGIHYRFDITAGKELGQAVALWALGHESLLLGSP